MSALLNLTLRDLKLAVREGGALGTALGFFLVVVAMLPLGLGPDLNLLSRIAPGILWIALLLAALLSLPRVFEGDYEDGALEVMAAGPLPLEGVAAAKSLAHWISTGIPLALMAPVLGILLNLESGGLSGAHRHHAGRHARGQLPGRDRRGLDATRPPRRASFGAAGASALRSNAHIRDICDECGGDCTGRLLAVVRHAGGHFVGLCGARADRIRCGITYSTAIGPVARAQLHFPQ